MLATFYLYNILNMITLPIGILAGICIQPKKFFPNSQMVAVLSFYFILIFLSFCLAFCRLYSQINQNIKPNSHINELLYHKHNSHTWLWLYNLSFCSVENSMHCSFSVLTLRWITILLLIVSFWLTDVGFWYENYPLYQLILVFVENLIPLVKNFNWIRTGSNRGST